jgi:hypothetical protein
MAKGGRIAVSSHTAICYKRYNLVLPATRAFCRRGETTLGATDAVVVSTLQRTTGVDG